MKVNLKEYLESHKDSYLFESKADESLSKIIASTKEDLANVSKEEDKEEIFKEAGKKIKTVLDRLIKNVARDSVYIDDEKVLKGVKTILRNAEIVDEEISDFIVACENEKKREDYEFDVMKDIAGVESRGRRKKKEDDKEEKETDPDADAEAKNKKALSGEDTDKLEKETEEEISKLIGKSGDLEKKTLLAIIKKENDGEIMEAILGETSLKDREVEGLEYEEDVMAAIVGGKKFTTPAQIAKRIKELKGTKIYFYSAKKKEDGDNPWTIVKVK